MRRSFLRWGIRSVSMLFIGRGMEILRGVANLAGAARRATPPARTLWLRNLRTSAPSGTKCRGIFFLTDRHRNPNAHSLNEVSCACFFVAALTATRFEVSDCTTTVSVPVAWLVWRLLLNLSGHCLFGLGRCFVFGK